MIVGALQEIGQRLDAVHSLAAGHQDSLFELEKRVLDLQEDRLLAQLDGHSLVGDEEEEDDLALKQEEITTAPMMPIKSSLVAKRFSIA